MNLCFENLRAQFERADTKFEVIEHGLAFTAQEAAAAGHIRGHTFCKSVVVIADGTPHLLVLPAPHIVDLDAVRSQLRASQIRLATESEIAGLYPDCEVGAMPPFPGVNAVPVCIDRGMLSSGRVAFEAGSHTEAVAMAVDDYVRLVAPRVFDFARERQGSQA
jgi:Ala-tRNA(Pro) deacylase